ncbi:MAG: primosomal protein N', partial [Lentisphaerae bacterium]|nr:primosomal protein N' [Lentisphaerota bacterium]
MAVARVVTDLGLDREFDYLVPDDLQGQVRPGSRVVVPFGSSTRTGYVVGLKERSHFPRLKPIAGLASDGAQIPANLLRLADWLAQYYCCPREHAVRAMLPAVVRGGQVRSKRRAFACLAPAAAQQKGDIADSLTPRQRRLLEVLVRQGSQPLADLCQANGVSSAVAKALVAKGLVVIEDRVVARDPFAEDVVLPTAPLDLSAEQAAALEAISTSLAARDGAVILLQGVTGSGKTEVYLQAIQHCLDSGREAIVLVPEIALTPQTCERFRGRFGDRVSVMHSGLSDGERFDEWTRVHQGRAAIVVGARSALFAPFHNLGLIVVDEEHESTYKQEESPRYHARDVAVVRGKLEQATVVLGSATPSLESYQNAQNGKYRRVLLTHRVDHCEMPSIELVDMTAEAAMQGHAQIFSRRLQALLEDRLGRGEQTILFLNRRGYATQFMCTSCGYVAACPDCETSYTYHRRDQMLCCHLCGRILPAPKTCPQCGNPEVRYSGVGTEKIEVVAQILFPRAVIARMDSDNMTTRRSYSDALEAFRAGRVHVLIGTQMIAKGLHFPNCTLVGVLNADLGLHLPDFRASERTFQLLTQVAGRAGRGERAGHVVVQTYSPYHPALQFALQHDVDGFYGEELPDRVALGFPPATHMVMIHIRGPEPAQAEATAAEILAALQPRLAPEVRVSGPLPAPIAKIRGQYRYQITLRGGNIRTLGRLLREAVLGRRFPKDIEVA